MIILLEIIAAAMIIVIATILFAIGVIVIITSYHREQIQENDYDDIAAEEDTDATEGK